MTDPLSTLSGRPTSLPPKRPSSRATQLAKQVADHPATPWLATIIGVGLVVLGGVLIYQERNADKWHLGFHGGTLLFGIALVPGGSTALKQISSVLLPFVPWAKKDTRS